MKSFTAKTAANRLGEIRDNIEDLIDEANAILEDLPNQISLPIQIYAQAKSYWLAHIETALGKEHDYLGRSQITMQCTIDEIIEYSE